MWVYCGSRFSSFLGLSKCHWYTDSKRTKQSSEQVWSPVDLARPGGERDCCFFISFAFSLSGGPESSAPVWKNEAEFIGVGFWSHQDQCGVGFGVEGQALSEDL